MSEQRLAVQLQAKARIKQLEGELQVLQEKHDELEHKCNTLTREADACGKRPATAVGQS